MASMLRAGPAGRLGGVEPAGRSQSYTPWAASMPS